MDNDGLGYSYNAVIFILYEYFLKICVTAVSELNVGKLFDLLKLKRSVYICLLTQICAARYVIDIYFIPTTKILNNAPQNEWWSVRKVNYMLSICSYTLVTNQH